MSIYDCGWLIRFLDSSKQPKEIRDYIEKENRLLTKHVDYGSRLVDLRCGFGRHLELLQDR